jgi:hypothetical protein
VPVINGAPVSLQTLGVVLTAPNVFFPEGPQVGGFTAAVGLTQPGVVQNLTVKMSGDPDCTADSTIDAVRIMIERAA